MEMARLIWSRLIKKYLYLLIETRVVQEPTQESNNIFQVTASIPKNHQRLLGRIRIKHFFDIRNVSSGVLIGTSDGSEKFETGTGSWYVTINKKKFAWSQITFGGQQPYSYREE